MQWRVNGARQPISQQGDRRVVRWDFKVHGGRRNGMTKQFACQRGQVDDPHIIAKSIESFVDVEAPDCSSTCCLDPHMGPIGDTQGRVGRDGPGLGLGDGGEEPEVGKDEIVPTGLRRKRDVRGDG